MISEKFFTNSFIDDAEEDAELEPETDVPETEGTETEEEGDLEE